MLGSYQRRDDFDWAPAPAKKTPGFFGRIFNGYTLTDLLTVLTLLELWGALVSFVLLISMGDASTEFALKCKVGLLLSIMLSVCTGTIAYLSWSQDKSGTHRGRPLDRNW